MKKYKGVISAGDKLTSEAGAEILKAGGNAFDAAIAATFMSFAASSSITSAGGGGFLLAHQANSSSLIYDFFVQTPKSKRKTDDLDFYPVDVDFGDKMQEFHVGLGSVATPGNIAGLFEVYQDLGSMPMSEIMAPVLDRMKKGIELHKQTKYQIDILTPILTITEQGKLIYLNNQKPLAIGDTYFLPQMVDTFDYLARSGPEEFYEGEIAQRISTLCNDNGGNLTYEDFKSYRVMKRKPLAMNYRDAKILTNPPPNSGGPLIILLLKMMEGVSFEKSDYGKAKHLQALAEAIRLTGLTRIERFEKNVYANNILEHIFDPEFVTTLQQTLQNSLHKSGNTTHVSVIDQKGNVAACTTSVGEGCGYFIPGTGVMLNNMLGEEDINKQGFHKWEENTRMSSMMSPTVVLLPKGEKMGLGSGGSNRIRSAISQTIMNYVDFQLQFDDVVNNPRIHLENDHLDVEPGFRIEELDKIKLPPGVEKFYWNDQNMYFGGAHAVFMDAQGRLDGAGDRRRVGHVIKVY
ncbi:MAG: gamma-glutamyltransferase [Cyclobacteriaceae bacterium]|nr:gamma-glutamyltransferase [Cyclobacteriaceae bacterium]